MNGENQKKPRKKRVWQPKPVYITPSSFSVPAAGPQMSMSLSLGMGISGEQVQVMKFSPRVREKPLGEEARKKLFTFKGRKIDV